MFFLSFKLLINFTLSSLEMSETLLYSVIIVSSLSNMTTESHVNVAHDFKRLYKNKKTCNM